MNARRLLQTMAAGFILVLAAAAFAGGFAGLGRDARGFTAVVPETPLFFPEDFGAQANFRIEWWYVTANLEDSTGVSYGAQWTLFRQAMEPGLEREGWSNQNVWMGHAAVTSSTEHFFTETFARGGIGQAGVTSTPFRAWIDDWYFTSLDASPHAGLSEVRVSATGSNFRYSLNLAAAKPIVLHGEKGFSRKSGIGQASYYYSQPFFKVEGTLVIRGQEVQVSGQAWMDREWSSQPLAADQTGWDWFSLHLSSGEKLMLFRLRSQKIGSFFSGTWIAVNGTAQPLNSDDIVLTPLSESTISGRTLPTKWLVEVKSHEFKIKTAPLNAASWMATKFPYWEGPISFDGSHRGQGYLEMTGY